jgi:SPP1 family predicted phage head-tail adaptor
MAKGNVLKDKKITIYTTIVTENDIGGQIVRYQPIHPGKLWAYVRQLSAKEYFAAAAVQNTEEMLFTVNWRPDITPQMYIEYKGVWYNIQRVDTFEGYKENLHLYASQMLQAPRESDIIPYKPNTLIVICQ